MPRFSALASSAGIALALGLSHGALAGSAMAPGGGNPALTTVAGWSDILSANNQISVDFAETYVDYMETVGDTPFDSERGWLPGMSVSGSLMRDWVVKNLYLYGQFTWATGNTNYVGSYQGGNYGDLTLSDGAVVDNEDFRVGKGFGLSNGVMLTPYIGAGARQWSRNLPGPGGYHEDYSHGYAGGGLLAQFSPSPRWVISANGLVGSTFGASMRSSLIPGGFPITPQTYDLGSAAIYMAGLSIDYAMTQRVHANVGIDYSNFRYGESQVSSMDGSYEPDSRTSQVALKVGLGFTF
jgi:hypothetical protein